MQLGDEVENEVGNRGLVLAFAGGKAAWVWMYKARRGYWYRCDQVMTTPECKFEKSREGL